MRHDTQTLIGMTAGALKEHYEQVRADYLKRSGKDARLEAYLITVNAYIEKREQEGENE